MAFSFDDLKEIDANEMGERPVLPKGKYEVELGQIIKKEIEGKNGLFTSFAAALTVVRPVDVSEDDLEAAAAEWGGGSVDELLKAQVWFRRAVFDRQGFKDMHTMLKRATGVDLPGDESLLKATKGLSAIAQVDVEVWDGTPRNQDVKRLLPVEG